MLHNTSIRTKLILTFLFVAGLAVVGTWITLITVINSNGRKDIAEYREQEMGRIKNGLKDYVNIGLQIIDENLSQAEDKEHLQKIYGPNLVSVVDMADSVVQQALKDVADGKMSVDEAKKSALTQIRRLRYDNGTGYVFIIDNELPYPHMLLHPIIPQTEGKMLDDPKYNCALGKNENLFVAMANVCRTQGAGFVDYLWGKPSKDGVTSVQPKYSYVRLVKEWDWILGTGIYVDDAISDAIEQAKDEIQKIRYDGGSGYLWVNDMGKPIPKMVMHPIKPELDGKVLDDPVFNTALGRKENLFKAIVDVCAVDGEGFVDYTFDKKEADGSTRMQNKLSYAKLNKKLNWVVGTGVYLDDVEKAMAAKEEALKQHQRALLLKLSGVFAVIGALALVLFFVISNRIALPLQKCAAFCAKIGIGDLSERLVVSASEDTGRKKSADEVVAMSHALNDLRDSLKEKVDMAERIADGDLQNEVKVASEHDMLSISLNRMITNLRELLGEIRDTADVVSSSSTEMTSVTAELAAGAEETSVQANTVAGATEEINVNASSVSASFSQVADNVTGVARATESMNKGIVEINNKAEQGAHITDTAYQKAQEANRTIQNLVTVAAEIDEVTKSIGEITEQTKLLALNATIEAARAGEAGKGFAVVANEVKELALQSAQAADNISSSIREVQRSIGEAVSAMTEVADTIREVNDSSTSISTSIQEQGNITSQIAGQIADSNASIMEINKAMEELSLGIREVSSNIQGVSQVANDSGKGLQQLGQSANDLAELATRLQSLVHKFKL